MRTVPAERGVVLYKSFSDDAVVDEVHKRTIARVELKRMREAVAVR